MSAIEQGASGAPANLVPKNRRMPSSLFAGGEVIPFQGKTKHLTIDVYHSRGNGTQTPITGMTEYAGLVEVFTEQYLDIYPNRDREISIERMKRSLSHPRTIAMLVRDGDIPVGFGIFPKLLIGGEPVFYSSRALLPDYEEQGAGTYMLERGIQRHQQESHRFIHYGVLMTQNPFSIVTLRKLQRKGVVGKILPYDELYDRREGAEYVNWDAQDFMLGVYREVRIHSRSMSSSTEVSKSELIE